MPIVRLCVKGLILGHSPAVSSVLLWCGGVCTVGGGCSASGGVSVLVRTVVQSARGLLSV